MKKSFSFAVVVCVCVTMFLTLSRAHAQKNPVEDRVDGVFAQWNKPDSPGCALSVMQGGHIIYKHGYGMADLDHDVLIPPSRAFFTRCIHVETIYGRGHRAPRAAGETFARR